MTRNIRTTLRRKKSGGMAEFDRLPQPLRAWLHQAALPWSIRTARKLWDRAMAEAGCEETALSRLRAAEAKTLSRDRVMRF